MNEKRRTAGTKNKNKSKWKINNKNKKREICLYGVNNETKRGREREKGREILMMKRRYGKVKNAHETGRKKGRN
jgi:hypothetical protein